MPFTPFHFGLSACLALPLNRYIDLPVFVLANVAIDIEPLVVMLFDFSYPLHGYAHTLLGATIIGIASGVIANYAKNPLTFVIKTMLRLPYSNSLKKYVFSGVLGTWLHILLDSTLYTDIKPFYPFSGNSLFGIVQSSTMYKYCAIAFIPAIVLYFLLVTIENKRKTL